MNPHLDMLGKMAPLPTGVLVILLIVVLVVLVIVGQLIGLWIRSSLSGAHVGLIELLGMRLRKVNALTIVNSRIQAQRAGLNISTAEMELHYLAGGDVQRVTSAMIAANRANIDLPWNVAAAMDLAGRDILDAVQLKANAQGDFERVRAPD